MGRLNENKKYESFKIPQRPLEEDVLQASLLPKAAPSMSFDPQPFYEIELDPGNGKNAEACVPQPQRIEPPAKDEIRELFHAMREVSRMRRHPFVRETNIYSEAARAETARIFYCQAIFMKDFEDSFEHQVPFSSYFPYYQLMGYEQLRTYFTWRKNVRKGSINNTSLSYAFLYIYELLNNVGVENPQDGLEKLKFFWNAFRTFDVAIDPYVKKWLKDYHIYYGLPLDAYYPDKADPTESFDLYCAISKYDIRKSAFFDEATGKLIRDCFLFVIDKLKPFDFVDAVFQPAKKMSVWMPFKDALFYHWTPRPDRRIVLSENEIYICSQNKWTSSTAISAESGRRLVGYMMKQMESILRSLTNYKYKLTAKRDSLPLALLQKLDATGMPLEKIVQEAVQEFYREATKTVVSVDEVSLNRVRREALITQEKLVVSEDGDLELPHLLPHVEEPVLPQNGPEAPGLPPDGWATLKAALTETELRALSLTLRGEISIKQFADEKSVMLEVLAGGINEKAADHIGDSILDDDFSVYDDYKEHVMEMAG